MFLKHAKQSQANQPQRFGNDQYIYVVLSRSQTVLSSIIHILKGDSFTHASLSLDPNLEHMFSFGRKWASNPFIGCFRQERLNEGMYKSVSNLPGAVIKLPVSAEQYRKAAKQIGSFQASRNAFGYNYMGLLGNIFGNPAQSRDRFFCSEFVYHVLLNCGICDFGIQRQRVRPQDLLALDGEIVFEGNLMQYRRGFVPLRSANTARFAKVPRMFRDNLAFALRTLRRFAPRSA
jgi:hypothetical protein